MPRTGFQTSGGLFLELDPPGHTFKLGDIVTGVVKFKPVKTDVQQELSLPRLSFWGRTKTKLVRKNGNGTSIYRGRAMLFSNNVGLTEVYGADLDDGVVRAWRFKTVVPSAPTSPLGGEDSWDAERGYLSSKEDVSKHTLPPVFYYDGKSGLSGTKKEAYVEYAFTATSVVRKGNSGSGSAVTATLPLMIRHTGTEKPISDFDVYQRSTAMMTKTLTLLPEKAGSSLTFREKMRTSFKPSKIPQFFIHFVVHYPRFIQLGNPTLPFKVQVKPREEEIYTTIPPSSYPSIRITSFSLKLSSTTHMRCQTTFSTTDSEKSDEVTLYNTDIRVRGLDEVSLLLVPDPEVVVDLGSHLQLAVHRTRTSVLEQNKPQNSVNPLVGSFRKPLQPTFKTYNIALTHELIWKGKLEVVGTDKTMEFGGQAPVTVLGECDEYIAANEERKFDGRGVKKNYDDVNGYAEAGINLVSQIVQAVA